ncbi:CD82 antigen-like isoform X2 [Rhinatrema bivittatum]|uniref:CD82 antigen-like isoform X2 n=1 Tax=Rhinatrema bivittatum TaxID=194408 RepID=UPI00112BE3CE|nr:CD82 antigen-like isoform X2 [Rhinatrema bivittatum]
MATKGCLSVTKYFLFIFNLFFFVLGGLLFGFGLWILFDKTCVIFVLGASSALKIWSYVFSGVGIFTMLLGFLGCLGSLKEIRCLLGFYFGFLLLLFAAQITVGVLLYTQRNTLRAAVGDYVKEVIKGYGSGPGLSNREESWDFIQSQFQCCGWIAFEDWEENGKIRNASGLLYACSCSNTSLPAGHNASAGNGSASDEPPSGFCPASEEHAWPVHRRGCMSSIQTWLAGNILIIMAVCLGVGLLETLQLLCLTLLLCLERKLSRISSSSSETLFLPASSLS